MKVTTSMEHKSRRSALNAQIYEEACEWFLEFRTEEPDASLRKDFDAWMRRSPEHVAAYLEAAALWSNPAAHDLGAKWSTAALIDQARASADNVVAIDPNGAMQGQPPIETNDATPLPADPRRQLQLHPPQRALNEAVAGRSAGTRWFARYARAAAILLAVLIGVGGWLYSERGTYTTAAGEQRLIALRDGSTIDLNARTTVRVRYEASERSVELVQGQALFRVAQDRNRPFVVSAENSRIRAVGTQFDVYRKSTGVVVTVVEGRVAVSAASGHAWPEPASASSTVAASRAAGAGGAAGANSANSAASARASLAPDERLVSAGEQLRLGSVETPIVQSTSADIDTATAWTRRKIVFNRASLLEVAEEFNRYSERRLIIDEPTRFDFHLSGTFASTDVASIVRYLRARPEIEVEDTPSAIHVRKKAPAGGI